MTYTVIISGFFVPLHQYAGNFGSDTVGIVTSRVTFILSTVPPSQVPLHRPDRRPKSFRQQYHSRNHPSLTGREFFHDVSIGDVRLRSIDLSIDDEFPRWRNSRRIRRLTTPNVTSAATRTHLRDYPVLAMYARVPSRHKSTPSYRRGAASVAIGERGNERRTNSRRATRVAVARFYFRTRQRHRRSSFINRFNNKLIV